MKRNGKNIITSDDITVLGKNSGKTLEEVLESLLNTSDELKSNVKWLYKYGGVGGKGGGSDSPTFSDKWSATVQLTLLDGRTINVPLTDIQSTSEEYLLAMFESASNIKIIISNPYGLEFKAKIFYSGRLLGSMIFNKTEGYSNNYLVNIRSNGNLEVEISDTAAATDPKKYALKCIVNAYSFQDLILYNDGMEIIKSSRGIYVSFMDDVITRGELKYKLIASTYYKFPLKIVYTTIDGISHELTFNLDSSKLFDNENIFPNGVSIIENIEEFFTNGSPIYEKAGTYPFNVKKYIVNPELDVLIEDTNFLIDIIPSELYLSILTRSNFRIYNSDEEQDPELTYVGNKEFMLTPYNGKASDGSSVFLKIKIEDTYYNFSGGTIFSVPIRETVYPVLRITLPEGISQDWITLTFEVCPDSLFDPYNTRIFIRYIKVKKYDETIDWYPSKVSNTQSFSALGVHYRYGETSSPQYGFKNLNNQLIDGNTIISKSSNDEELLVLNGDHLLQLTANEVHECIINIGILYNDINDDAIEILKISGRDGSSDFNTKRSTDITISLNSITYGTTPIGYAKSSDSGINYISGFFINREVNYKESKMENYLLITITRRYIKEVLTEGIEQPMYELAVYINGVLLTCKSDLSSITNPYCKIVLNNCNYSINLLDIQHLNDGTISDSTVVRYWYAYNSNILENSENIETKLVLLDVFDSSFKSVLSNNCVTGNIKVFSEGFNTLCNLLTVPIMCLKYDNSAYNGISFMEWSDKERSADGTNDPNDTINVQVWWKGKTESKDPNTTNNIIPRVGTDDGDINGHFTLEILGSTTRSYKSKNYTLTLEGLSQASGKYIPIFTPKFEQALNSDSEDIKKYKYNHSFLPEQSFTLKADVVDSSHTNNTCMGSFINDITTKFNLAGALNGRYVNYIKNCLQGFPFLLFVLETTTGEYYYLGIYNFNLGRKSYFNLGYVDISLLDTFDIEDNLSEIYYVDKEKYENVRSGFVSAEILLNKPEFDFSQYDLSILFKLSNRDIRYMFGDIVPEKDDLTVEKISISNFVKNISRAGGYIFKLLLKGFVSENTNVATTENPGYNLAHYVPLASQQWIKYEDNAGNINYLKKDTRESDFTLNDLTNCISVHLNYLGDEESPYCDYISLVEYYTICMAFGLLDNVQKNLTIKTWNNNNGIGTYHFAFYDMDTCLGINNLAGDVKYFAFSDYWGDSERISANTIDVIGELDPKPVYFLDSINILRDYAPPSVGNVHDYFDIPSHYAFAIAKYAKSILGNNSNLITPLDLWAYWRTTLDLQNITLTTVGCLSSAQKFLDNYYNKYMEGIDELMFNYNYRAKYFKEKSDVLNVYNEELSRFHGNRRNYVKDWLTKRFHILDAYFNLNQSTIPINDGQGILDGEIAYYDEPKYSNPSIDFADNDDVQITKDIFTSAGTSYNTPDLNDVTTQLIIKAPDFTPLMIREGEAVTGRYLLNSDLKYYSIIFTGGGASLRIKFLGSTLWTYLHNINFMSGTCSISSRYLENLVGYKGAISSWNIALPSLKIISLTSPNYSGSLNLNLNLMTSDYYLLPNLRSIDISNSKISLNVNSGNIKSINLDNINSTDLVIQNCSYLNFVSCNNIKVSGTCSLAISWSSDFTLSNCGINNLNISSLVPNPGTLTISNDLVMTNLNVTTFKKIVVNQCNNLLRFTSLSTNVLSVTINECKKLREVEINVTSCKTLILNECSLESIILRANELTDFSTLEILQINGSTVQNIECKLTGSVLDLNSSNLEGLLNLSLFKGLKDCYIRENVNIKYIQFANETTPIKITSKLPFKGLNNLERIYGNILFEDCDHLFYNLTKFSLHGTTNTGSLTINGVTYNKTKNVTINGTNYSIVQTPFLLVSGESSSLEEWTHSLIISAYDSLIETGINSIHQNGLGVTNISFSPLIKSSFLYIGYNSALTLFDIYYLFNTLALSKVINNITNTEYAFYTSSTNSSLNNYRTFKYSEGNLFNRYMFYGCQRITSLGSYVFLTSSGDLMIYPPTTDSSGNVIQDDGLFSPLINLSSISLFCGTCYSNRFIFRRYSGKYNSLISFSHLDFTLLLDDINNYKVRPEFNPVLSSDNYGSLEGLFDDTPNIKTLLCSFNTSNVINYSTLRFPTSVVSIANCFSSSYGKGSFNWELIFDSQSDYSKLLHIDNSFRINSGVDGIPVDFELYDTMLCNMPSLVSLGYDCTDPSKHTNRGDRSTVDYYGTRVILSTDVLTTSINVGFTGNGYNKILRNGEFPYLILLKIGSESKKKLISFGGLFSYLSGASLSLQTPYVSFPGNMFDGIINLEDLTGLFMNSTIPIRLTSKGFKDCPYLCNVTRLFYNSESYPEGNLSGYIPNNFFYIGELSNSKSYYTTKEGIQYDSIDVSQAIESLHNENPPYYTTATSLSNLTDELLDHINLRRITVTYNTPKKFIKYASECFYGLNKLSHYEWNGTNYLNELYKNPLYIPVEHYINESNNLWITREDSDIYTCEYDISSLYDGVTKINGCYCKDSDNIIATSTTNPGKNGDAHYICPPDIFSSFINSSDVSIRGFFKWCGYSGNGSHAPRRGITTALEGRICPYLFNPISNISNLVEIFEWCKGLTTYLIQGNPNYYMLPPTIFDELINVNNISKMMAGTYINNLISWPFTNLSRNSLDIRGLFSACKYSNNITMASLFNGLKLNNISGVFCGYILYLNNTIYDNLNTITTSREYGQGVRVYSTIHLDNFANDNTTFSGNFSNSNVTGINYTKFLYLGLNTSNISEPSLSSILTNTSLLNTGTVTSN